MEIFWTNSRLQWKHCECILPYDQTDAAPPPPTKVDQRAAAAAEPKHPVRRRRPNVISVGSSPPGLEKS